MVLERDGEVPEPVQPPPPSKSPSLSPRPKNLEVFPEGDAQESGEEQPETEVTPLEDNDTTGRWRDEVTVGSNPESAEEVG